MSEKIYIERLDAGTYRASFDYDKELVAIVKKEGKGTWNASGRYWVLMAQGVTKLLDEYGDGLINMDEEDAVHLKADASREAKDVLKPGMIAIIKQGNMYCARFDYDKELVSAVKTYGRGTWEPDMCAWVLPAHGVLKLYGECKDICQISDETLESARQNAAAVIDQTTEREPGKINIEKSENGYRAYFDYDSELVELVRLFGHGRWNSNGRYWALPATGVLELLDAREDNCHITDEVLESAEQDVVAEQEEKERKEQERKAAEERARQEKEEALRKETEYWETPAKERLKDVKPIVDYDFKSAPYPHQVEAFNYMLKWGRTLVADEPGLGKTAESIYATDYLQMSGKAKKCLIVCGVNTIKYNWLNEIRLHSDQKAVLIDGTEEERLKLIDEWKRSNDSYYAIINIEALRKDSILERLKGAEDCVVCDEVHKAKNYKSKQGRALRALKATYLIGLTGTPVDNKAEDLYNILAWLGIEKRRFVEFRNEYCVLDKWGSVVEYKNLARLKTELSKVMIRRKKSDVVDLPEKIYKTEYVDLSKAEAKKYRELQMGILDDIDKIIDMDNPLSGIFHLREVTGGLYTDDSENAKLERIRDIIDEEIIPAGKKAIIFSRYEEIAEIYARNFDGYCPAYITGSVSPEKRQEEVERFQNDPDCKLCIGTIGAMGTGITLTAASTVIFADKDWTVSANRQAEDRAHRIGTTDNVDVITLVAKNTIDEYVETILQSKELYTDLIMEGADVVVKKAKRPQMIAKLLGVTEEELEKYIAKAEKAHAVGKDAKQKASKSRDRS